MDLKNQNGANVQGNGSAKEGLNHTAKNNEAKKGAAPAAGGAEKPNGKMEAVKQEPAKPEATKPEPEKVGAVQPEAVTLPQAPQELAKPVKLGLNLESTLKVLDDLHRRSIQRTNLISRIKQLEAFEVNLATENDELEENPYQGCKLIIEDDKQRRFITTTPGLIRMVAQFIFDACNEKLGEIEAHIVFPNA